MSLFVKIRSTFLRRFSSDSDAAPMTGDVEVAQLRGAIEFLRFDASQTAPR
jgi:hypothetical protein